MAMTRAERQAVVVNALKDHIPFEGAGNDRRTLAQLEQAFLDRHLYGGLVRTYQDKQVRNGVERFTKADL